jgi:hypothetical protein
VIDSNDKVILGIYKNSNNIYDGRYFLRDNDNNDWINNKCALTYISPQLH